MNKQYMSSLLHKILIIVFFAIIFLISFLFNNYKSFFPNKHGYFINESNNFSVIFPAFMNKPRKIINKINLMGNEETNIIYIVKNEHAEMIFGQVNISDKFLKFIGSEQKILDLFCNDETTTGNGINIKLQDIKFKNTYNSIKYSYISTKENQTNHKRETNIIGSIIFAKSRIYKLTYIPLSEDANNCKDCGEKICNQFLDSLNIQ